MLFFSNKHPFSRSYAGVTFMSIVFISYYLHAAVAHLPTQILECPVDVVWVLVWVYGCLFIGVMCWYV